MTTGSLNYAIAPIFISLYKNEETENLRTLANSIFNLLLLIFLGLAAIQVIYSNQILGVILPGFEGENLNVLIYFFRVQSVLSIFTVLTSVFLALNYAIGKLYKTIYIPIIAQTLQLLFVIAFYERFKIDALLFGLMINQIAVFVLYAINFIPHYRFSISFNSEFRDSIRKILPLMFSASFSKSNLVVDRYFSSQLSAGSLTLIQYGQKIITVCSSILNRGISIVTLRSFSIEKDNPREFLQKFMLSYRAMIFMVVPITFLILMYTYDVLSLILISDKIDTSQIGGLRNVILCLVGVFIGGNLTSIIVNAFYAKGLTAIVSKVTVIVQSIGIVLKIILFFKVGFYGLPIAFSIASLFNAFVFLVLLKKHVCNYPSIEFLGYFGKVIMISIGSLAIPFLIDQLELIPDMIIKLVVSIPLFLILYSFISFHVEKEISRYIWEKVTFKA